MSSQDRAVRKSVYSLPRRLPNGVLAEELALELSSLREVAPYLPDMLAHRLANLIVSMSDVTSAITKVAPELSTRRPTQLALQRALVPVQRDLSSTVRLLLAMIAQSSSSMQGSGQLFTATHIETLGDSSSSSEQD